MTQEKAELLNCPCCGKPAQNNVNQYDPERVGCVNKDCFMRVITALPEQWNARATSPERAENVSVDCDNLINFMIINHVSLHMNRERDVFWVMHEFGLEEDDEAPLKGPSHNTIEKAIAEAMTSCNWVPKTSALSTKRVDTAIVDRNGLIDVINKCVDENECLGAENIADAVIAALSQKATQPDDVTNIHEAYRQGVIRGEQVSQPDAVKDMALEELETAIIQVSGGLCCFKAEGKHASLKDVQTTLLKMQKRLKAAQDQGGE